MVPWEPRRTRVSFQEPGCAPKVPWERGNPSFHGTRGTTGDWLSSHGTMGTTGNPAELPGTRLSSHSTMGTGKPELPWYQGNHGGLVELPCYDGNHGKPG